MSPPVVVELSPVDVSQASDSSAVDQTFELTLSPSNPALIALPGGSVSATTTTTQDFPTGTVVPATTSTTVPASTTTTTRPATTTTVAPVTTTTVAPVATAPPTTTPVTTPAAGTFSAAAESEFLSKINGLRSSVGVAGLAANGELNNYARYWAKQMADTDNFSHSDIASLLDPWSIVGENIGYGPSVTSIFDGFVNSPGHYNNLVDARFTSVGVGAYVDASGRIWTAHVFGG